MNSNSLHTIKTLPQSYEAEIAVLGAIMTYPEISISVEQYSLSANDFFDLKHKTIFNAMLEIVRESKAVSAQTLITKLMDKNELENVGGIEYLAVIADGGASPSTIEFFIDNIQEKSQKRNLIQLTQELTQAGFNKEADMPRLLEDAQNKLQRIAESRRVEAMQEGGKVVNEVFEQIRNFRESGDRITGLETGYSHLDNVTSGLQSGDLIILAARPSVGKTAFALNLGLNITTLSSNKNGQAGVAIFSLEMPATHLMMRILSAKSGIEGSKLRTGRLTDEELGEVAINVAALQQNNIFIDDNSSITMPEIFAKCRQLKNENKLDIIIIDYIQLITGVGKSDNRQQEVSEISRSLKLLAREMNVPVIALSQLSRLVERRDSNIPQLSDLRESGSIEQDADIVMFLYRKDYHDHDKKDDKAEPQHKYRETQLLIRKHRNGALADIDLHFEASVNRFYTPANTQNNPFGENS